MNNPASNYSLVIDSPLGKLGIRVVDEQIHRLDYLGTAMRRRTASSAVGRRLVEQLQTYFDNPRAGFSVPLVLAGTPFQQHVWQALTEIPPGETRPMANWHAGSVRAHALSATPAGAIRYPLSCPATGLWQPAVWGGTPAAPAVRSWTVKAGCLRMKVGAFWP